MWIEYNANPKNKRVGDCVIRAIARVTDKEWDEIYLDLMIHGYELCDMPSSNLVWGSYLRKKGFTRNAIPNTCPDCYTVRDFCREHDIGRYVLATAGHAVASIDGNYWDTFDCGDETIIFYWEKENE